MGGVAGDVVICPSFRKQPFLNVFSWFDFPEQFLAFNLADILKSILIVESALPSFLRRILSILLIRRTKASFPADLYKCNVGKLT